MCDVIPNAGHVTNRLPYELVPKHYVGKLNESYYCNVTCDNWFTTLSIVDRMLQIKKLTMIGTRNKNKP